MKSIREILEGQDVDLDIMVTASREGRERMKKSILSKLKSIQDSPLINIDTMTVGLSISTEAFVIKNIQPESRVFYIEFPNKYNNKYVVSGLQDSYISNTCDHKGKQYQGSWKEIKAWFMGGYDPS